MQRDEVVRIATWNVDHARSLSRDPDRSRLIDSADTDVIVLTETRDRVPLGPAYSHATTSLIPVSVAIRWSAWTRLLGS